MGFLAPTPGHVLKHRGRSVSKPCETQGKSVSVQFRVYLLPCGVPEPTSREKEYRSLTGESFWCLVRYSFTSISHPPSSPLVSLDDDVSSLFLPFVEHAFRGQGPPAAWTTMYCHPTLTVHFCSHGRASAAHISCLLHGQVGRSGGKWPLSCVLGMVMGWGEILIPRRRRGKRVCDRSGRALSKFPRTPAAISNQHV